MIGLDQIAEALNINKGDAYVACAALANLGILRIVKKYWLYGLEVNPKEVGKKHQDWIALTIHIEPIGGKMSYLDKVINEMIESKESVDFDEYIAEKQSGALAAAIKSIQAAIDKLDEANLNDIFNHQIRKLYAAIDSMDAKISELDGKTKDDRIVDERTFRVNKDKGVVSIEEIRS